MNCRYYDYFYHEILMFGLLVIVSRLQVIMAQSKTHGYSCTILPQFVSVYCITIELELLMRFPLLKRVLKIVCASRVRVSE